MDKARVEKEMDQSLFKDSLAKTPVKGRAGSAWMLWGAGVPSKFSFFESSVEISSVLFLANNMQDNGPYIHAEKIQNGMVHLNASPYQETDHAKNSDAWNVAFGEDDDLHTEGCREETELVLSQEVSAWLVKTASTQFIFISPFGLNSRDIATALIPAMPRGEFGVKAVFIAQVTLAEPPYAPGFITMVEPYNYESVGIHAKH